MSLTHLSVELIPRAEDALRGDTDAVKTLLPAADMLNIPDLMRFPLRSWDAAALLQPVFPTIIPHIRAIDIAPDAPLPGATQPGLREILVVHGDPPADLSHRTYPNSTESIIRRYKKEAPHLRVYAAFDPYRRAPWRELEDVARKKEAGAEGFFTQPVFDRKLFDLCREWLRDETVFWGLSPVIGPRSRSYWETTNHVVFPKDFSPTLDANIAFAQTVLRELSSSAEDGSVYLMPLRVKLEQYLPPLQGVLG
ncbi:MAG: methylenetetrahydrofolate reductase [Acetobacter sp.]|uniref:methylenetetrahydrofolate reductase n=1 Tax=Acetobacter sp. TaxID=440 RepID=UPI003F926167